MVVGIHQPYFLPWLGYFDKLARSDVFIILDDVQYQKGGRGTLENRVKLAGPRQEMLVSVPIKRDFSGTREIRQLEIDDSQPWREKLRQTLRHSYGKTPYFQLVSALLEPALALATPYLCEMNLALIRALMEALELQPSRLRLSSQLPSQGASNERLISLIQAVGGDAYLCGASSLATYIRPDLFEAAGIRLQAQDFRHPVYPRKGEFFAGVSIVDALFHIGPEATRELLQDQGVAS